MVEGTEFSVSTVEVRIEVNKGDILLPIDIDDAPEGAIRDGVIATDCKLNRPIC